MKTKPQFELGQVLMTQGVSNLIADEEISQNQVFNLISRHENYDFGEIGSEDYQANLDAIENAERIVSVYIIGEYSFYLITEWNRSHTTLMLKYEY